MLEGNRVSPETAGTVAKYDFQQLVLSDFGIKRSEMVFDWEETEPPHAECLLGEDGWTAYNAKLTVNGTAHEPNGFKRSYLQYGTPKYDLTGIQKPFEPLEQKGSVYAKYFEEADISIFFYVIALDDAIIEHATKKFSGRAGSGQAPDRLPDELKISSQPFCKACLACDKLLCDILGLFVGSLVFVKVAAQRFDSHVAARR